MNVVTALRKSEAWPLVLDREQVCLIEEKLAEKLKGDLIQC
jgi:hypothetical protein